MIEQNWHHEISHMNQILESSLLLKLTFSQYPKGSYSNE